MKYYYPPCFKDHLYNCGPNINLLASTDQKIDIPSKAVRP